MILKYIIILALFTFYCSFVQAQIRTCQTCHDKLDVDKDLSLKKSLSSEERAIGVLDKGQLANYIGNYGIISHYLEYFNNALHWPAAANNERQYSFGLGLVVAVKGNVITSVVGAFAEKVDWVPKDGSRGKIFSGDVTAPPPDLTPFLPMSDNYETWPEGYFDDQGNWIDTPGKRHWPGHYRIDINPDSPSYGKEVEGQFVSDRDIYCVFDDSDNFHPEGPVGIEVEHTAYSYGRPYAEDMLLFEYIIHNKSGRHLDSVYVGYYAVFRPDYDFKDYINIIDSNPQDEHPNGDFVYVWDINNTKDGPWEDDLSDMGIVGLNVLETPNNLGVTDFHYFNREVAPKTDEKMWAIITSNPHDANLALPEAFFHGNNRRIDDTHPDSLKKYFPEGAPINFYIMTGPFDMAPNESVKSSMAIVMGSSGIVPDAPDTTDLMKNIRVAQQMYQQKYQGSGPPKTPVVKAVPGDRKVQLFWDSEAENSIDVLTDDNDFEGYKIYRSTDKGKTWGTHITDYFGNVIGYKPIMIFDKIDGIKGPDPAFNQSLGNDTGLRHSYVDSNLINGFEYWYCVTAYDKGNQDPNSLEQSYQSALGHSTLESHTVAVTPGVQPMDYEIPEPIETLSPVGGKCDGEVYVDIVDPEALTGHGYKITFVDSTSEIEDDDTIYVAYAFTLIDTTDNDTLLHKHPFSDESGDNLPIVDGFRLRIYDSPSGVQTKWTKVNGSDSCDFYWDINPLGPNDQVVVYSEDNFKIVIDTTETGGLTARYYDLWSEEPTDSTTHLPLRIFVVTDPENPIEVSENTWLGEFITSPFPPEFFSPPGWNLIPGGAGYVSHIPTYPDRIIMEYINSNEDTSGLRLVTNNGPEGTIPPSHGDEFTIRVFSPFRKEIHYAFGTTKPIYKLDTSPDEDVDLSKIRVVPDPYIVSNIWETSQFGKRLQFNHLPSECKIKIYTVAGDHIRTIYHNDNKGYEFWDMRTNNDQFIAYGLYVYVVSLPNGQKKVGKFLVIK